MALDWQHPGTMAIASAWALGMFAAVRAVVRDVRRARARQRARAAAGQRPDEADGFWPLMLTAIFILLVAATLMSGLAYLLTADHDGRRERQEDWSYVEP